MGAGRGWGWGGTAPWVGDFQIGNLTHNGVFGQLVSLAPRGTLSQRGSRSRVPDLERLPRADTPRRPEGRLPITLEGASRIGDIMKYVDPTVKPQVSHSFYMRGFRGRPRASVQ